MAGRKDRPRLAHRAQKVMGSACAEPPRPVRLCGSGGDSCHALSIPLPAASRASDRRLSDRVFWQVFQCPCAVFAKRPFRDASEGIRRERPLGHFAFSSVMEQPTLAGISIQLDEEYEHHIVRRLSVFAGLSVPHHFLGPRGPCLQFGFSIPQRNAA